MLDSVRGRENTSYIDKVGITHWVTLWQVNHLWSTRENTRDWGIRGWVGGGLDPIDQAYFSSSLQNRYDHKLVTGECQGAAKHHFFSFLDYVVLGMSLMVLTQSVDSKCWLVWFGFNLGQSFRVNNWTAEQSFTQIRLFFSVLDGFVLGVALKVLTQSIDLLTCWIWV